MRRGQQIIWIAIPESMGVYRQGVAWVFIGRLSQALVYIYMYHEAISYDRYRYFLSCHWYGKWAEYIFEVVLGFTHHHDEAYVRSYITALRFFRSIYPSSSCRALEGTPICLRYDAVPMQFDTRTGLIYTPISVQSNVYPSGHP